MTVLCHSDGQDTGEQAVEMCFVRPVMQRDLVITLQMCIDRRVGLSLGGEHYRPVIIIPLKDSSETTFFLRNHCSNRFYSH